MGCEADATPKKEAPLKGSGSDRNRAEQGGAEFAFAEGGAEAYHRNNDLFSR